MSRAIDENTPTSTEMVIDALMEGIRTGRYIPGQRVFAGDFAEALGISRSPVREAFHQLAGEGVLDLLPNRGVEIRRLSHKHIVDMMAMLRVTGSFGLELTIPKLGTKSVRQRVTKALDRIHAAGENRQPYEWFEALVNFHHVINQEGDNIYLTSIWKGFHLTHFNRMLAEKLPGRHWEQYIRNYNEIGDALFSEHPERAIKLFNAHMRWALRLLDEVATTTHEIATPSVARGA